MKAHCTVGEGDRVRLRLRLRAALPEGTAFTAVLDGDSKTSTVDARGRASFAWRVTEKRVCEVCLADCGGPEFCRRVSCP